MSIKLANVNDIPEGKGIIAKAEDGREIALFKVQGQVFALENVCPHMGGPLGEGDIEGTCITCPWHGWQFDIKSGTCENMPGEEASKIEIFVKDGFVYLKD